MTHQPISRRSALVGAAAVAGAGVAGVVPGRPARAADPYLDLLARRRDAITGGAVAADHPGLAGKRQALDATADGLLATLDRSPTRVGLWPDMPLDEVGVTSNGTVNLGNSFARLNSLALVWASAGSARHDDPDLLAVILAGLETLSSKYNSTIRRVGNWWFWEIGNPRRTIDILTLLGERTPATLTDALVAAMRHFAPDPNRRTGSTLRETGANRADKALACGVRGLLARNDAEVVMARDCLSDVDGAGRYSLFGRVTSGDGFYADGSFVQHGYLPYSGTYGAVAISGVAEFVALVAGSTWAVTDPAVTNLYEAIEKTFAPFQWDARAMDTTRGRAVSRQTGQDIDSGYGLIAAMLRLTEGAPGPVRDRTRELAKGWLTRTTDRTIADSRLGLAAAAACLAVVEDPATTAAPPLVATINTVAQERIVHHRGDWAAVVNTSSTRIGRYEWGNRENNLGWYQGDGLLFLHHRRSPGHYSDGFWPTVDPYALPGTTVNAQPRTSGAADGTGIPRATNTYAGGLTLAGTSGTTAMDLRNHNGTLTALKSWHFLPDGIVCLGSAVTDTSGTAVATIVENRCFPIGSVPTTRIDGRLTVLQPGSDAREARLGIQVDGHAGFVPLAPEGQEVVPIRVRVERRTGTWQAINSGGDTGGTDEPVTRDFLRIDQPHDAATTGHAYLVLPLATHLDVITQATAPRVRIPHADHACHMVATNDGTWFAHFFTATTRSGITVDRSCAIGITIDPGVGHRPRPRPLNGARVREIVVADPRKAGGAVTVTFPFDHPGGTTTDGPGVTVLQESPLTVRVDLGSLPRGEEHRITFD